jgi:sec-independent protein translocase protein TatA
MGGLSWPHLIIFGAVALILFGGKGKISDIMGDVAKGIKSFKKGLSDEPVEPVHTAAEPVRSLDHQLPVSETNKISETHKIG